VLRDDGRGALIECSSYTLGHTFGDVLRRHAEHYHRLPETAAPDSHGAPAHGGIASAHERVAYKHLVTAADLVPDAAGRVLFADTLRLADGTQIEIRDYRIVSANRTQVTLEAAPIDGVVLRKDIALTPQGFHVEYRLDGPAGASLAAELNLAMPSCDGYGGRYRLEDGSFPGGFGQPLAVPDCRALACEDAELQGRVWLRADAPLAIEGEPHATVSQSEAGLEKIMQGACLRLRWTAERIRLNLRFERCESWL
jgi:hypothetical protein